LEATLQRAQVLGDEDATTSSKTGIQAPGSKNTVKDQANDTKKRRISRAGKKPVVAAPGGLTPAEHYELIDYYTNLFLKYMQTIDRNWELEGNPKSAVLRKARRGTNGRTHYSLSLLHEEFRNITTENAHNSVHRCTLHAQLENFEKALPYWSPKCKATSKQADRLNIITEVVQEIAGGKFNFKAYTKVDDPLQLL
jgi:hypothetical protein